MEITGSGQITKKDIWVSLKYSYKYILLTPLGSIIIFTCLAMIFLNHYFDIAFYGYFDSWQIISIVASILIILLVLAEMIKQFKGKKLNLGRQETVLIDLSGITISSKSPLQREEYRIDWNVVEDIQLKKGHLHIYTKPASKLLFFIPLRYFSEGNLLETIHQIQASSEVKNQ